MIAFHCLACSHRLKAPRELGGRVAQCLKCSARVTVPAPGPARAAGRESPDAPLPASALEYDDGAFEAIFDHVETPAKPQAAATPLPDVPSPPAPIVAELVPRPFKVASVIVGSGLLLCLA